MAGRIYTAAIAIKAALGAGFTAATGQASSALAKIGEQAAKVKAASAAISAFKGEAGVQAATRRLWDAAEAEARLAAEIKATAAPTEKQLAQQAKLAKEVAKAEAAVKREIAAADREAAALRKAGVDTANLTGEQKRLADALAATERQAERIKAFENLGAKYGKLRSSVGSFLGDMAKVGAVGAAGAAGLAALVHSVGKADDDLGDAAAKIGIGVGALSQLRYAGELAGMGVEEVDGALGKLAINLGKVYAGGKKGGKGGILSGLAGEVEGLQRLTPGGKGGGGGSEEAAGPDPFKRLGLSQKELRAMKPEDQVASIAEGIKGLGSHAEQASATVAIFGKSALGMLPTLKLGREGIDRLREEADALGITLSTDAAEAADAFDKQMIGAGHSVQGVKNIIGREFLPVATQALREFTGWVKENKGEIKAWAKDAAQWFGNVAIPKFKEFVPKALELVKGIADGVKGLADFAGGWKNLAVILVGLRLIPVIKSLVDFGVAVGSVAKATGLWQVAQWAVNVALLANPIGLVIVGIAALIGFVAMLVLYWDKVTIAAEESFVSMLKIAQRFPAVAGLVAPGVDVGKTAAFYEEDVNLRRAKLAAKEMAGQDTFKARIGSVLGQNWADPAAAKEAQARYPGLAKTFLGEDTTPPGVAAVPPLAIRPSPAAPPASPFAPQFNIQVSGAGSREEAQRLAKQAAAEAERKMLEAWDARAAEQKRLNFVEVAP